MSDRVHFEFVYEYGEHQTLLHHGSLPREEFERLVRGEAPLLLRVDDVSSWDNETGSFVALGPKGSEPAGAAYFLRDRMTRLWPVSPPAGPDIAPPQRERRPPPQVRRVLEEFFGSALEAPRIIKETLLRSDLPNLELAVEDFLRREAVSHKLVGVAASEHFEHHPGLRRVLMTLPRMQEEYFAVRVGPPEWKRLPVEPHTYRDCLAMGLYLVESRRGKLVFALWPDTGLRGGPMLEVMALDQALARAALDDLRVTMARLSIYRGKVIELRPLRERCGYEIAFAEVKIPARDEIVLPEGLLDLIERNALAALHHRERLLAAGRHLRRGLLFHGKPGTGKTLTARYLVGQLEGYTTILLTGPSLEVLPQACQLGRALSPSAVIIEDVDLIACEREENRYASLLHNLLDEMDGLSPKIEMVFILTTNHPDILEPALTSRPGRVDQAIEFPLPDRAARRSLFDLYARGLPMAADLEPFVERTRGASGAFIEELLRRALVFAAEERSPEVRDCHLDQALRELTLAGGELTLNLLGFEGREG